MILGDVSVDHQRTARPSIHMCPNLDTEIRIIEIAESSLNPHQQFYGP